MKRYTDTQIKEAVKTSQSIRQVLVKLGLAEAGGNYSTIKRKIRDLSIDTSHFLGRGWNREGKFVPTPAKPLESYLVKNSSYNSHRLKNRLLAEGLKFRICENCKLDNWQDKPIPLELHHLNGVPTDNRLKNLQLLCPNCHAQTNNYRAKNISKV